MRFKVGDRVERLEGFSRAGVPATVTKVEYNSNTHGGTVIVDFDSGPSDWSGYADRFTLSSDVTEFEMDA